MNILLELKNKVISAKDLNDVLNTFFDLMDNHVIQSIKGHKTLANIQHNRELLSVISSVEHTVSQFMGKPVTLTQSLLNEIPSGYFYHGICFSKSLIVPLTLLYFSDVGTGVFTFMQKNKTAIFRFSMVRVDEAGKH